MSILHLSSNFSVKTNYFFLTAESNRKNTKINMQVTSPIVNTRDLPLTYDILRSFLPSILQCQCFNDEQIPFYREVRHTEIGHLFEHILLEYLCEEKLAVGFNRAEYSGVTNWNWQKEPWGNFHITITAPDRDFVLLKSAISKSIPLLTSIIESNAYSSVSQFSSFPLAMN